VSERERDREIMRVGKIERKRETTDVDANKDINTERQKRMRDGAKHEGIY
jgi:hypothetical protein